MDRISNPQLTRLCEELDIRGPVWLDSEKTYLARKALAELQERRKAGSPEKPIRFKGFSGALIVFSDSRLLAENHKESE